MSTTERVELVDLTERVMETVAARGVREGLVTVCSLHTTAAVLGSPAAAHLGVFMLGYSLTLQIGDGELVLGEWQRVLLAELDGPRTRQLRIQILGT